jgi:adenine C2-methylase RlmN of 23S rRNA A2503 and tRNA A37
LFVLQFCYTGRMGLLGNLTTAQMVEQLVEARRWLAQYTQQQQQAGDASLQGSSSGSSSKKTRSGSSWPLPPPRINNIVFMGEWLRGSSVVLTRYCIGVIC